ncbi:MAG: VOC family protein [Hydrogenophaga sp.]|uniref:VOC family protein n=1 Tax=Hydrogenophaga sp. TaxID=1904254 RepID=UPI001D635B9F|nr:VOC family protein [Hydrogenophaga sp.]MBX3610735.1 VOC family protein [Hydrogenophaga sp.]
MPQLAAYLAYDGQCAEAMHHYARLLGAKVETLLTFDQVPGEMPVPPGAGKRVMHAHLVHPDFTIMASDAMPGMPFDGIKGAMLAITYEGEQEARRIFDALADGGHITMPWSPTFWAEGFGMVTDRFGTPWGVNGGPKAIPSP